MSVGSSVVVERLIRVSAMRWPIEACFETGKQLLGMGDYEIRSWGGAVKYFSVWDVLF